MSVIVRDDDFVPVSINYLLTTNKYGVKRYRILTDEETEKVKQDEKLSAKLYTLNTKWKPQTWQDQNDLFTVSSFFNPQLNRQDTDWNKFRAVRLLKSIVQWDAMDEHGRILPLNDKNKSNLHSTLANALSNRFDEIMSVEDDELGELQILSQP
jgi:hypothetical protein